MDPELVELNRLLKAMYAVSERMQKIRFKQGVEAQARAIAFVKSRQGWILDQFK